jgi:3-oxoacyl-[acyl-carrier-protein] synthase III
MADDRSATFLVGLGVVLPPQHRVPAVGDDAYRGWKNYRRAAEQDHPSTMGARALADALARASLQPADLSLVVYAGVSRDYPPSWSAAVAIMGEIGVGAGCVGMDIINGCLGALLGLEIARRWLRGGAGQHAAVVCAERWAASIARDDAAQKRLWGNSDGAAAAIVSASPAGAALEVASVSLLNVPQYVDHVLVKYGGTRHPVAPPHEDPQRRILSGRPYEQLAEHYRVSYERVATRAIALASHRPDTLVCNQISPNAVDLIADALAYGPAQVIRTGEDSGHMGPADVLVGLRDAIDLGCSTVLAAASSPYSFGAAVLRRTAG